MKPCGWALSNLTSVLIRRRKDKRRDNRGMHTQGKDFVGTQKGVHMQAKKRDFKRNQSYQNLYSGQSTSRSVRNKFVVFKPLSL